MNRGYDPDINKIRDDISQLQSADTYSESDFNRFSFSFPRNSIFLVQRMTNDMFSVKRIKLTRPQNLMTISAEWESRCR